MDIFTGFVDRRSTVALSLLLSAFAFLGALTLSVARADSTRAECGFAATADKQPDETSACSFSQRQGYIYISIDGGPEFDLSPAGQGPGNFTNAAGQPVYRRSGLGDRGQLFQLPERYLYVYWLRDQWGCSGEQLADPAGCQLVSGDIVFTLHAGNTSSLNQLTVQVAGPELNNVMNTHDIDGRAYRAEVADLDANGWPEVFVYISSAGSGSYGSLVAYAVNNGNSATPIYLRPLADDSAVSSGYMGHDEFAVVENRLVQRFPVYQEGDTNSEPSGGTRQLQYQLVAGEAGWVLEVDRVFEY